MRSLSLLPSKADDETKGELRLAIYQRMLGRYPNEAISYMVERALMEFNWFPSPKQCLDILADWREPQGEAARRRAMAVNLIESEKRARYSDVMEALERRELDGDTLARLPEQWKLIAVERGYLRFSPETGFVVRPDPRR